MIPLSRHDVDPLLHVTDETETQRRATSISDSDDELCDDSEDSDSFEDHMTSSWQLEENVYMPIQVLDLLVLAISLGLEQLRLLQMEQMKIYHLLHLSTRVTPRRVVVRDDFNLDYDRPEDRNTVMSTMNTAYMTHQNRMHQYYALFPTKEEALEHPYPNMKEKECASICELFSIEEFQEKIEALQLQHESEGRSFTEVEIFTEVLGRKRVMSLV
ncbi:hypothetical protein CJ030_MR7G000120 [Morella rubra]|uniref:Uncharacterized protein n=1 Tax=Morella rubra TaxID=262757 RepID=A0A6A1V161_9ROSI|nr:hypothetical protein CJ030_MR7G000120 [Morella rubra]